MKRLLFILLLVFSCTSFAISTETVKKARDATVIVTGSEGGFGSGAVITSDGLVITNYHVIHRAEDVKIFFWDREDLNYYLADIVGIDPVADLALLQVNITDTMKPLTYLEVGTELEIAEEVVAIGHPMGLQWSVTKGIINHLERPGKITPYVNVIQHSAQINRGNSGGPLINNDGEIVGINTYILAPKGQWAGVAYAVRYDTITNAVEQILETGEVKYAAMKMGVRNMNEYFLSEMVAAYPDRKFPTNIYGLIVAEVEDDDYAHKQGIRNFDTIVALNGEPVNYLGDLKELMKTLKPGDVVKLLIIRDGHFRKHDYTIGTIDFSVYLQWYDKSNPDRPGPTIPTPDRPD